MIGIIGAMDEEVEQLVEVMEITREETKACMTFKAGKLAGKDVVISSDVLHHDMDATGFGYPLGQIPRMDTLSFAADERLIKLAGEACKNAVPEIGVHVGRVVSGDQFISDKAVKERISSNFDGFCTEMEGAAIAQVSYLNKVPFVILRTISDKADDSATMDYPAFEKLAIANNVKVMKELVANI